MSTKLLEGERALVTGCAGGIGRGIAKALKEDGAVVLGSDINAPPVDDGIDFLAADLGKRDGWKGLLSMVPWRSSARSRCSFMPRARHAWRSIRRCRCPKRPGTP
jgi:NAD(P)-dependent dehydrogenase (short-subunit alcohol dehydrogenase family)